MPSTFSEKPKDLSEEREKLLQMRISELGLKVEGTWLESLIQKLYQELEDAGIRLKPKVYLSDEWGCPEGVPVIGIPFYLADEKLSRIQDEILEGIEGGTEEEFLKYLRHEAGHAFNYAYKLFDTNEWRETFGPYSRPYREDYKPNPFSRDFVRHISGWYAQKHPDEDFAESFAVWLTPGSNWREAYKDWGCFKKLLYVERIVKELGSKPPLITGDRFDTSLEMLQYSIGEYNKMYSPAPVEIPNYFDTDLKDIFGGEYPDENEWEPAHRFLSRFRRRIGEDVGYWTGLHDGAIKSLLRHFIERAAKLDLRVDPERREAVLIELAVYTTTLCMNRLQKGDFISR
jgi:hypothetical protein